MLKNPAQLVAYLREVDQNVEDPMAVLAILYDQDVEGIRREAAASAAVHQAAPKVQAAGKNASKVKFSRTVLVASS